MKLNLGRDSEARFGRFSVVGLVWHVPTECSGYDFSEVIILWTGATRY